jgi:hypothetical protein
MRYSLKEDLDLFGTNGFYFTQGSVASSFLSRCHGNHCGHLAFGTTAPFPRLPFATDVAVINLDDLSETAAGVTVLYGFANLMALGPNRWIG